MKNLETKAIPVSGYDERRKAERNPGDRHPETECVANVEGTACRFCGRPMSSIEIHIYRAL